MSDAAGRTTMGGPRGAGGLVHRIVAKLREVGPRYALSLLLERIVPARLYSRHEVVILHLPTAPTPELDGIGRWSTPDDRALLTQFGHGDATLAARFAAGDRAWLVEEQGRLLGYCWFTNGPYFDEATGLLFEAHAGEVWLYDAMVDRASRGRGIYPRLLSGAAARLARESKTGIWILSDRMNRNSIRAHVRAGATPRGTAYARTVLGLRFEGREPAAPEAT